MAKTILTVSPSTVVMEVGQTATLVARLANGVLVSAAWSSFNSTVADVGASTGLVTASVPGFAKIQGMYRGMKATCAVTVVAAPRTDLTITNPGTQTVTGTGALTVVTLPSIITSGGVAPITVTFVPASGSSFPVGTTLVTATATSADQQRVSCQFSVTVTGSFPQPPGLLTITCPPPILRDTPDGDPVAVTFAATTTGGTAPVTLTYTPTSGSDFSVGTTGVGVKATSADGQSATCGFPVTVWYIADSSLRGPQASITCPVGAVGIATGASIQSAINANPGATTFCLAAGVHTISASITPKTGNVFVGAFGAIVDGTGWTTADDTQGAFRAHNQDIDNVTIRNLVIRNMPQQGIHSFRDFSSGWTVENCEIHDCWTGVELSPYFTLRNCLIHHNVGPDPLGPIAANRGGGYIGNDAYQVLVENCEIAYNGAEQKLSGGIGTSSGAIWRNNWVHHNVLDGIWFDTVFNSNALIEGNLVEDNGRDGISLEATKGGTNIIRNNAVHRNQQGIYLAVSQDCDVYNNTCNDNTVAGISFWVDDRILTGGDLNNNSVHGNRVKVAAPGAFAVILTSDGSSLTPYWNLTKRNICQSNTYLAPNTTGNWFVWNGNKTFTQWKTVPQDSLGTLSIG